MADILHWLVTPAISPLASFAVAIPAAYIMYRLGRHDERTSAEAGDTHGARP